MSHLLDRLNFLKPAPEPFSDGHGATRSDDRSWEAG
jgi:nitrate reductase alpha subunit